jgi:lysophospholipase L1-like esterase
MKTVAFYGSSTIAGKGQAFDIVSFIQQRHSDTKFINFGSGGDNAYDALQRIDPVIKCNADTIILLIGANDVLIEIFPKLKRLLNFLKSSPQRSNPVEFEKNTREIVHLLKTQTHAKIALSSLALIGENVTNPNLIQKKLNDSIKLHSSILKKIAEDNKIGYIPFYETMYDILKTNPGKSFNDFNILPMYRDAFRTLILGWTPDKVAIKNGWTYHSDGIHLNSKGALVFVNLIENYLTNGMLNVIETAVK